MKMRNLVVAVVLAAGSFGFAAVGQAARYVDVDVGIAPAPEPVEVVPAPRDGYIYEPGHYEWNGAEYVWIQGQYFRDREGHVWRPYVLEHHGDRWHFRAGHWDDDD